MTEAGLKIRPLSGRRGAGSKDPAYLRRLPAPVAQCSTRLPFPSLPSLGAAAAASWLVPAERHDRIGFDDPRGHAVEFARDRISVSRLILHPSVCSFCQVLQIPVRPSP
jgi:hypothetical protein